MFGAIKLEFAWILAREKILDPDMVRMLLMKMTMRTMRRRTDEDGDCFDKDKHDKECYDKV